MVLDRGNSDADEALRQLMDFRVLIFLPVLAYFGIVAYLYVAQRSMLYMPANKGLTPEALGLDGVERHVLPTPDGETIVLWHAPPLDGKPTILFLHGNAGEIGDRDERLRVYRQAGFGICFVSYRGFGGSTGSPTEQGTLLDAETAYLWLREQGVSGSTIALVGESLGTGIAVQLATRHEVGAVALEAPYTSTADVASLTYWWLPVSLLMKDQYRSIDHIAEVSAPLLIMHGDADEIIPVSFGKRLFEAAREPKELYLVPGGLHDAIHDEATWMREIDFFERHIRP